MFEFLAELPVIVLQPGKNLARSRIHFDGAGGLVNSRFSRGGSARSDSATDRSPSQGTVITVDAARMENRTSADGDRRLRDEMRLELLDQLLVTRSVFGERRMRFDARPAHQCGDDPRSHRPRTVFQNA